MTEQKTANKTVNKKKSKKKQKTSPLVKLLCFVAIGVSAFMMFEVAKLVFTTYELKQRLEEAEEKLQIVKDENVYLVTEREKLTDPEYVQTYARVNYMLSKSTDEIFYLPEKED